MRKTTHIAKRIWQKGAGVSEEVYYFYTAVFPQFYSRTIYCWHLLNMHKIRKSITTAETPVLFCIHWAYTRNAPESIL